MTDFTHNPNYLPIPPPQTRSVFQESFLRVFSGSLHKYINRSGRQQGFQVLADHTGTNCLLTRSGTLFLCLKHGQETDSGQLWRNRRDNGLLDMQVPVQSSHLTPEKDSRTGQGRGQLSVCSHGQWILCVHSSLILFIILIIVIVLAVVTYTLRCNYYPMLSLNTFQVQLHKTKNSIFQSRFIILFQFQCISSQN